MSLPSINFLHLTVSEIQAGQTFSRRPPAHPDTMGENNTPTALKGCGVKTDRQRNRRNYTNFERNLAMMVIYVPVKFEFDRTNRFRVRVRKRKMWMDRRTSDTSIQQVCWLHATHLKRALNIIIPHSPVK